MFYKKIIIHNKNVIPQKGPLMVLANHPTAFMDPIVIATMLNRKVYFLAKGELFKSKFAKWILPKFNMIPVYRKQDDPSQMNKNDETFNKCYEHLEKGGAILMFPEGVSITERKLKPIKTGAARIVLGAEARNNFNLNVNVLNIGLNYASPHKFNKDLFINIHEPIKVADYKNDFLEDSFKGAKNLTNEISNQLEKIVIAIEDEKTDALVYNIETLYKQQLSSEQGLSKNDKEGEFNISKKIVETVNYFKNTNPNKVKEIEQKINSYFENLKELNLKDDDLKNNNSKSFLLSNIKSFAIIIFGLPFFIYGFLNNILPFEIPSLIAKRVSQTKEFVGPIGMVLGFFFFLTFYCIQIYCVWKYTHLIWLTSLYGISLPITGLFAYWYHYTLLKIKSKWYLLILFYKKSAFISNAIIERQQLIIEFEKAKKEYISTLST